MGIQQLLLIVIGVIIVGLMVVTGISMMRAYSESSNRDQIISNFYDLGLLAQTHYKKNFNLGGGGGTFTGWSIPMHLIETDAGTFAATVQTSRVNLRCNGKYIGRNGKSVVRVTARVDGGGIRITVVN